MGRKLSISCVLALVLMGMCVGAHGQVLDLNPTYLAQYYWDPPSSTFKACPNASLAEAFGSTPQAITLAGLNSGLGQWTPQVGLASCLGSSMIDPGQIIPATVNNYVLTTITAGQPPVWAPPGSTLTIEHNGSAAGIDQTLLNFNDTTPAAPSGNQSVTFQTDSGGALSAYVPAPNLAGSLAPAFVNPVAGQTIIIRPTGSSVAFSGAGYSVPNNTVGLHSASLFIPQENAGAHGATATYTFVGALAANGITAGQVTAVHAFAIASTFMQNASPGLECEFSPFVSSVPYFPVNQFTISTSLTGSTLEASNCQFTVADNSPAVMMNLQLYDVGYIVTYTGTPIVTPSVLSVQPCLFYNAATTTIGLSEPCDFGLDTGTLNAMVVQNTSIVTLAIGQHIEFMPAYANTSSTPTLLVNGYNFAAPMGTTPATIVKAGGSSFAALSTSPPDLKTTAVAEVIWDGVYWELQNPQSGSGGGGGSSAFSALTSGTNTTAAMVVGSGASLAVTGTGTIAATTAAALAGTPSLCTTGQAPTGISANGNATGCASISGGGISALIGDVTASGSGSVVATAVNLPGGIALTGTPSAGQVVTATSSSAADWQTPSSGGGGVQYNPSNTLYMFTGDSRNGDDPHILGQTITVTAINCNGTVCIATNSGSNNLSVGDWISTEGITSPSFLSTLPSGFSYPSTMYGVFQVIATGLSSTQFEWNYTLNTGTGSGGTAYGADYWMPMQTMKQPFFAGHGNMAIEVGTGTIAGLVSSYTALFHTLSPTVTGNPGYMIIDGDVNSIQLCSSESSLETAYSTLWQLAHNDGWKVLESTTASRQYSISGLGCPTAFQIQADVNAWILAQGKSRSNSDTSVCLTNGPGSSSTCGMYWDNLAEPNGAFPDPNNTLLMQSNGSLSPGGVPVWSAIYNSALSKQSSDVIGTFICGAFGSQCPPINTDVTFTSVNAVPMGAGGPYNSNFAIGGNSLAALGLGVGGSGYVGVTAVGQQALQNFNTSGAAGAITAVGFQSGKEFGRNNSSQFDDAFGYLAGSQDCHGNNSGSDTVSNVALFGSGSCFDTENDTDEGAFGVNARGAGSHTVGIGSNTTTDVWVGYDTSTTSAKANFHAAGYIGPATAPSGSCPTNGVWVFSGDGHATFCASGTWTTKI